MSEDTQQERMLKEKFALVQPWMTEIIGEIKKEIRQDHLLHDRVFLNKYFPGRQVNKLGIEELAQAYMHAILNEERGEQISEFIFHRWLLKNTDLYHYFDKELSKITDDYTILKTIDQAVGMPIKEEAIKRFGSEKTYVFCTLNGVVFDEGMMNEMRECALKEQKEALEQKIKQKAQGDIEAKMRDYEAQIARLKDRYEDKIAGWERKYEKDVTALKKQVAHLQRQLQVKQTLDASV